ncbi:hypothetical protein UA08_03830 [Talaromyces atroroseus]|uniref:Uncharacterized protein n=1 Tax=Talaromyces atroroseus TaxID=1441469 RepID=A0A225B1A5_TALAT|nr:hypothetical protein UA08_03830 [Talaromyces atroroseus]OKL61026.1 hypothetical protein UA08_03830 [Talaromyces atroroseus]
MFRRRSASRHQPLNTTPSASAQSAASRAFTASQDASAGLSSAAAAAALRSHTPPPTSVGSVQTKRMLQRQLSNSSRGSSSGGFRHGSQPTLRRTPSSGSMTSRTFREPSPAGRSQTSLSNSSYHAPPVPPIPQNMPNRTMPPRRSASVQPNRGKPPSTKSGTGRVLSLDRAPSDVTARATSPRSSIAIGNSPEIERPGSRTSVNFSYPISARPNSPPHSPVQHEMRRNSVEQPPSASLSPVETASIQQSISSTANRKEKTKPQTAAPKAREGSHFAHKTMGSRPTGTALEDENEVYEEEPPQPVTQESAQGSATGFSFDQSIPVAENLSSSVVYEHDSVQAVDNESVRPQPKKRPSMVMEDNEGEELAEAADAVQGEVAESPAVQRSQSAREALDIHPIHTTQMVANIQNRPSPSTSSAPSSPADRLTVDYNTTDKRLPERQPSISPNRSARFSTQLTIGSNSPLHEPPPRSVSPAKPALKNSSSPDRRMHLGKTPSEFSDGTSVASDDGSRTGSKKKLAKVSFDDEAEVVGVAASPPTSPEPMNRSQSPVEKLKSKKWFGIGLKKGTSTKDVTGDDEFESVLRPRPALPSFGSIRGTRDSENATSLAASDDDSDLSSDDDLDSRNMGASSDHAIGGILVNAHQHRFGDPTNESSLSETETRNHATPEVPSENQILDGAVVHNLPTVQEEESQSLTPPANLTEASPVPDPEIVAKKTVKEQQDEMLKEPVPTIAIQPATPGEDHRQSIDLRDMPGGFPSYVAERVTPVQTQQNLASQIKSSTQSSKDIKPPPQEEESDDDSGESIYSDAAEDPDELENGVFGSINAIVDSPVPTGTQLPKEAPDSPTRTPTQSDPLAKVAEPVPSPSLEAINPTMPATPNPLQGPIASTVSSQKQRNPAPANPSWPLKPPLSSSVSPSTPVQPEHKDLSPSPHQGSHLRKALDKGDVQRLQQPRQSFNKTSSPSSSTHARSKRASAPSQIEVRGNAFPRRQTNTKPLPQSMTYPASLSKMTSNDSDSDSSFKRTRRSSRSGAGGQFSMRRTMRTSTSILETDATRATSPRTSSMRTTMRGPPSERSSGFGSLRDNSTRLRPRSMVVSSNAGSRLEDSDDESSGGRRLFRSRFADSSDEDEPTTSNLTPVRGIPRRQGKYDGESTDLDDSSDEQTKRQIRNGAIRASQQMTQEDIDRILSQPKKKGILSRFRSPTRGSGKDGKVQKSNIEGPAKRDTPLERSRLELARTRDEADAYSARPISPKLQKKQKHAFNDTWPLSSEQSSPLKSIPDDTRTRPSTSDGIVNGSNARDHSGGVRPHINRHGTSGSIDSRVTSTASEVVVGHTGKKKRFPMLRKAFGLRD